MQFHLRLLWRRIWDNLEVIQEPKHTVLGDVSAETPIRVRYI